MLHCLSGLSSDWRCQFDSETFESSFSLLPVETGVALAYLRSGLIAAETFPGPASIPRLSPQVRESFVAVTYSSFQVLSFYLEAGQHASLLGQLHL